MSQPGKIAPKPHSFLARFTPRNQSGSPARPAPLLDFQTTLATSEYAATLYFGERDMLTTSADDQCVLLLAGDIYRPKSAKIGAALLELYQQRGLDFLKDLNGDFCLLLIDRRTNLIALVTDRMNSYKVLTRWDGGTLIASNSIYLQPLRGARIDRTAVASYLAVSHVYNDRTLFEGLRMLESSSVYRLADGKLEAQKYWRYLFEQPSTVSAESLKKDFGDLLIEATRLRVRDDRPIYLSLSGGYDSSAVMGILSEKLRVPNVHTFSYAHGQMLSDSDEFVSSRMAALCGYEHEIVPAFDGDIVGTLARNASFGGGMTRHCDEVDAWVRLGARVAAGPMPLMFTGDTVLLKTDYELKTVNDAVAAARMRDFSVLSWLEPMIGTSVYREFLSATRAEIDHAVKRAPATQRGEDLRDVLRFDQMHTRITGTWREYYAGRFFQQAHPLIDGDVLDFMLRLPIALRRGKILYQDTVTALFPRLFSLPRAESASYATYWPDALAAQKSELQTLIRTQSSPLDDVIDPEILLTLLGADRAALTRSNALARSALKKAYALLRRANWHRSLLGRPSLFTPAVGAETFLKRALTLRSFLTEAQRLP